MGTTYNLGALSGLRAYCPGQLAEVSLDVSPPVEFSSRQSNAPYPTSAPGMGIGADRFRVLRAAGGSQSRAEARENRGTLGPQHPRQWPPAPALAIADFPPLIEGQNYD